MIKDKLKVALPTLLIFSGLLVGVEAANANTFTRNTVKSEKVCRKNFKAVVTCFVIEYLVTEVFGTVTVEAPDRPVSTSGKGTLTRTGGGGERLIRRTVREIRRTPV